MPVAASTPVNYIIDFDNTFTKVEGLDELAHIALEGNPRQQEIVKQIKALTDMGMNGEISFAESLRQRISLLSAGKLHIEKLVDFLKTRISDSFQRNRKFLSEHKDHIYIVSSGFREFIVPIVTEMGILENHVFANEFIFDPHGQIIGFDEHNVLSTDGGKKKLLSTLNLQGDIYAIGDGYTDYELKESGLANRFYAFTENIERQKVISVADNVVASLDEFLFDHKLSRSQSYPKSRIKVLLLENVHPAAVAAFEEQGFKVEVEKGALTEAELCLRLKDVSVLGIRSKTTITKKVLDAAPRLMAIGAFCIGTNQIDLETATEKGIPVFNAPYSNTRSVVELAIGELIILMRNVVLKNKQMHEGIWDKSANGSFEIRNKVLGLIGYGNIGTQISVLAEALGMKVYFYDLADKLALGNAQKLETLEELLSLSDVVSLHVDGRKENTAFIGTEEFKQMKNGVIFLNLSRGHVVDIPALANALASGKVAGAGLDVFPDEPGSGSEPFESALKGLDNVILTPHIGGSTSEAQENIGKFVPAKFLEYINNGSTLGSVNFPEVQLPKLKESHRMLHIHQNRPGIMAQLNHVFAKYQINIMGQYLKTNDKIGYVIVDIEKSYTESFIQELRSIEGTIRFRMLF
ncbi:MAG: 3-phosphoglycerate dehydrogenase [Bacteroidetes bacterium 43-16]|nr:MAG: 3-phosphoglycerate dehydrogenase [Bacteroidetes bacterium 43-16]